MLDRRAFLVATGGWLAAAPLGAAAAKAVHPLRPGSPSEIWPGCYATWLAGDGMMTTSPHAGHG